MSSLTSLLRAGGLGRWCGVQLPGVAAAIEFVLAHARQAAPAIRLRARGQSQHAVDVQGAFALRVAMLTETAPPYEALLGLHQAGWLDAAAAHAHAAAYPSHTELTDRQQKVALQLRRAATLWRDTGPLPAPRPRTGAGADAGAGAGGVATVLTRYLARAREYQAEHAIPGTVGPAGIERGLARLAVVLSAAAARHRTGTLDPRLAAVVDGGGEVADLHALAPDPAVEEVAELAGRLVSSGTLARWRAHAPSPGAPLGISSACLVPGWADNVLLLGCARRGYTAVEVVLDLDRGRLARHLWRALLHTWLDPEDRHRLRAAGVYLARTGTYLRWDRTEFAELLTGDRDRAAVVRAQFTTHARAAIRDAGGHAAGL